MVRGSVSAKVVEWQQRLARFTRSGQSVERFCRAEGVSAPSFYLWRKKLQESAVSAQRPANDAPVGFTAVRLVSASSVTVRLPGGTQIEVPTTDAQVLRLAIQTLVEAVAQRSAGDE